MTIRLLTVALWLLILGSCRKTGVRDEPAFPAEIPGASRTAVTTSFITYTILKGQNYCDKNVLKSVSTSQMNFVARFDSSAIYRTVDPVNQYDINKLWGFSEGINNQYNSARVGWSYNNSALRLYGYVYAKGVRYSKEICVVPIGAEITCSIKLSGSSYVISAYGSSVTLPRGLTTTKASGYQQYPYFGGDETAPRDIRIYIKSL